MIKNHYKGIFKKQNILCSKINALFAGKARSHALTFKLKHMRLLSSKEVNYQNISDPVSPALREFDHISKTNLEIEPTLS